ncbi:MAG TPA: YraN family protein [Clostridiaceae bacterium]|nr:YraN family protein [Clostridiaceae bacterium]
MVNQFHCNYHKKGSLAETNVIELLRHMGISVWARNVFIARVGEIDIIANRGKALLFIEVKSCWSHNNKRYNQAKPAVKYNDCAQIIGGPYQPAERVGPQKRYRYLQAASFYIDSHRLHNYEIYFYVAACEFGANGTLLHWELIPML